MQAYSAQVTAPHCLILVNIKPYLFSHIIFFFESSIWFIPSRSFFTRRHCAIADVETLRDVKKIVLKQVGVMLPSLLFTRALLTYLATLTLVMQLNPTPLAIAKWRYCSGGDCSGEVNATNLPPQGKWVRLRCCLSAESFKKYVLLVWCKCVLIVPLNFLLFDSCVFSFLFFCVWSWLLESLCALLCM